MVLVTGMSGTGKSSVLAELARRGHRVVDTDYGGWIDDSTGEPFWREDRIQALLDENADGTLFIAGCVANQGKFYPRFEAIVLLSAPPAVLLGRVAERKNPYGKTGAQREKVLRDRKRFEPLLRRGATAEIDTRIPVGDVADELEKLIAAG